ncbi:MAG: OsmC family protein [Ignavibacteria bacterium]|nr:OsmC family protein [Ignavibacteria bacterium]
MADKHKIFAKNTEGMTFEIEVSGHKITVDASEEFGGKNSGPPPKQLMLAALAGCTGMDVVSLLKKMHVEYESFNLIIEGEVNPEHPKKYNKINITYKFVGKDIPKDKIEKAVTLSLEKYCGVSAVYKKALDLTYDIEINTP